MKKLILVTALFLIPVASHATDDTALFESMSKLANQGNPEAQYHLGMLYNNGIGTAKEPLKAFEWFKKAAENGDPLGAYKLGCYYHGQFKGVVDVNPDKSLQYDLVAANAGYALAQNDTAADYYERGNYSEALKWWTEAANQGDSTALYQLSSAYKDGKGVGKDPALAYAYLKLSTVTSGNSASAKYQTKLDQMKNALSPSDLGKGMYIVDHWSAHPSDLTIRARKGIQAAKELAVAETNPKPS